MIHQSRYRVICLDGRRGIFALVDPVDYDWATQWNWRAQPSRSVHKLYASRTTRINCKAVRLYLHKEILKRFSLPPSAAHCIGDHMNGDSLDCRRENLRWATPSENARNNMGIFLLQGRLVGVP